MSIQESSPTMYKGDDHKSPVGTPRLSPLSWSVLGRENDLLVLKTLWILDVIWQFAVENGPFIDDKHSYVKFPERYCFTTQNLMLNPSKNTASRHEPNHHIISIEIAFLVTPFSDTHKKQLKCIFHFMYTCLFVYLYYNHNYNYNYKYNYNYNYNHNYNYH